MNPIFTVIEDYTTQYNIPVILYKGEDVKVGERFTVDPDWPGWIWCENKRGEKGWVLERVLEVDHDKGLVVEDFNSRELNVKTGLKLKAFRSEAGWIWCETESGEIGWVPLKNVKQIGD